MSIYQEQVSGSEEIAVQIRTGTTTTIVDGTSAALTGSQAWRVNWLQVNEVTGGTASLTVELYDGTLAYVQGAGGFSWKAKAVTAYQSITFDQGILVPSGWILRVVTSATGFDVVGTKVRRVG